MKRDILLVVDPAVRDRLQSVREKHDPLAEKIPPHVTLVFPRAASEISDDALARYSAEVMEELRELEFVALRISEDGYLWLVPSPSAASCLKRCHDEFARLLGISPNREFEPHLTLGRQVSPDECERVKGSFPVPITLEFSHLLLEEFGEDEVSHPLQELKIPANSKARPLPRLGLNAEEVESLMSAWLDRLPPFVRQNEEGARVEILRELKLHEELASEEACLFRVKRMATRREGFESYRERILRLDQGRFVVAGIRFLNMNPEFPFVFATPNFSLLEDRNIKAATHEIVAPFSVFSPKGLLFRERSDVEPSSSAVSAWDHTVYGRLPPPDLRQVVPKGLSIIKAANCGHYEEYKAEYEQWMTEHPNLAGHLRIEEKEALDQAAASGLLFDVLVDGKWSGVVAAQADNYFGTPGVCLFEKFLTKRARGRGLSKFIEHLVYQDLSSVHQRVWGQIYSRNMPSLKSALRQGRGVIETSYFVEI